MLRFCLPYFLVARMTRSELQEAMNGEGLVAVFLLQRLDNSQQGKGGINRFNGVHRTIHLLEDNHKAIISSFIDIATGRVSSGPKADLSLRVVSRSAQRYEGV